jgi:hypothetical protein
MTVPGVWLTYPIPPNGTSTVANYWPAPVKYTPIVICETEEEQRLLVKYLAKIRATEETKE